MKQEEISPQQSNRSRRIFNKTGLQSPETVSPEQTGRQDAPTLVGADGPGSMLPLIKTEQDTAPKIDMRSDGSRVSHRTGNATFTTITSEESASPLDPKLRKNKNLQRNKKLW